MSNPILNAPSPNQHKLEMLRQHFPQAAAESLAYAEDKLRLWG